MPRKVMSRSAAAMIMRIMVQIEKQIERAANYGRMDDARQMARLFGRLTVLQFGDDYYASDRDIRWIEVK